jgi:hypothetical protein
LEKWHETKTKKYHDLANRIAEKGFTVRFFAFELGCRGILVGKSLRKFFTALELPKKNYSRNSHRLHNHCTEMLPKDRPQPFIIQFRTIMLIKGHVPDFKLEYRQLKKKYFFLNKHRILLVFSLYRLLSV